MDTNHADSFYYNNYNSYEASHHYSLNHNQSSLYSGYIDLKSNNSFPNLNVPPPPITQASTIYNVPPPCLQPPPSLHSINNYVDSSGTQPTFNVPPPSLPISGTSWQPYPANVNYREVPGTNIHAESSSTSNIAPQYLSNVTQCGSIASQLPTHSHNSGHSHNNEPNDKAFLSNSEDKYYRKSESSGSKYSYYDRYEDGKHKGSTSKYSPTRRGHSSYSDSRKIRSNSPTRNYKDSRYSTNRRNPDVSNYKSKQKSGTQNSRKFREKETTSPVRSRRSRSPKRSSSRYSRSPKRRHKSSPRKSHRASPSRHTGIGSGRSLDKSKSRSISRSRSDSTFSKVSTKSNEKVEFSFSKKDVPFHRSVFGSDVEEEKSESGGERSKSPLEEVKAAWVRSAPADLYYQRDEKNPQVMKATQKLLTLCSNFEESLVNRAELVREKKQKERDAKDQEDSSEKLNDKNQSSKEAECSPSKQIRKDIEKSLSKGSKKVAGRSKCSQLHTKGTERKKKSSNSKSKKPRKGKKVCLSSSSDSSEDTSSESSCSDDEAEWAIKGIEEMERKKNHPDRLHPELWFNDPGEMNDGPLCRCSLRARRSGIRHGYYAGEEPLERCDIWSNNADRLHHYLVTVSPPTNFLVKTPTIITHDSHEFIFEGFSLFSHHPLEEVPTCQVIRFNIEYSIYCVQEKIPENFCIKELELFYDYLFREVLELVDLNFKAIGDEDGCARFHFMPRFVRQLPDNGKEVLSMNEVLRYLLKASIPLVQEEELAKLIHMSEHDWLNYTDVVKGMIVTYPGKKPCSIRVDQLDRDQLNEETINYPVIVHFGIRPPQLSYAGNPAYQRALREYVKFRHLIANMPKPSFGDKRQLELKENRLQEMRMASKMKRDVTVAISSQGFFRTGIMCDIVQHALLIPVLVRHLRFHRSLMTLEEMVNYKFKTRLILQLAMTHPSYRENFGTNPDHARNSLTNCGVRQPQYGDRRIHFMNTHKRGINTLVNIMSRFGKNEEIESKITHNERLEFLGDAVVEFLTSIHLFHLFPALEEGGLATYRAAVVQNQHLSVLADKLTLHEFVLHAHGSDLCHTLELRHAMANCFEALMGAIFIDSNIESADAVFSATLFKDEQELHEIWVNYKPHPLQEQEPQGDRRWIETFPILQKLVKFEESIGVTFTHVRLLARAFTDRSIGFNYLTLGSNQRLEFLGDTVLQLVASEYLYRFFPEHHEGHLSLLRSSLVNNRTQAVVCDDLQMTEYAMYSNLKTELKTKDRADLLEAFLGSLYIDRGLDYCRVFCLVCFFPRLQQFIINQEWNDPKSKLQQCCLTLRTMEGGEPDIPVYKVIECKGPTNTRVYTVAVYFKDKRLAKGSGHSIQQAEMNAAKEALLSNKKLFPQLAYQRRVIEKNIKIQGVDPPPRDSEVKKKESDGGRSLVEREGRDSLRRGDRGISRESSSNGSSRKHRGRKDVERKRERSREKGKDNKDREKRRDRSRSKFSQER